VDWLEAQLSQIKEMGYGQYLSNQTEGPRANGDNPKIQIPNPKSQRVALGVALRDINTRTRRTAAGHGSGRRGVPTRLGLSTRGGKPCFASTTRLRRSSKPIHSAPSRASGPTTDRIARELIHDGRSPFVEQAILDAGKEEAGRSFVSFDATFSVERA
jgi:hypothetical protein